MINPIEISLMTAFNNEVKFYKYIIKKLTQ